MTWTNYIAPMAMNSVVLLRVGQCEEEKRCIEDFSLCQGDVTTEILKLAHQKQISLLVVS